MVGGLIEWDYGAIFGGILDTWGWGFGFVSLSRSWCLMHAISPNRKHSYLRQKSSNNQCVSIDRIDEFDKYDQIEKSENAEEIERIDR